MKTLLIILIVISFQMLLIAQNYTVIENFEENLPEFLSYPNEDIEPDSYETTSDLPGGAIGTALNLFGNTWKMEYINSVAIDTNSVFSVHAYLEVDNDFQCIGFGDSTSVVFYSFSGNDILDIETWVTIYQGAFSFYQWNEYQLPIGNDFLAYFDYIPTIDRIVYINNEDESYDGQIFFDDIWDITADLPHKPEVSINYSIGRIISKNNKSRSVDVQFYSIVDDDDSNIWTYFWQFGDGETSTQSAPQHTYIISDDHTYAVNLKVTDETFMEGYASTDIDVDAGETSFPIVMNFVGDIMLAREVDDLIQSNGVNALFEHTLNILGNAADITVANLECPLTNATIHHPTKTIYFKGEPESASGLQFAGIDVVNIANNHIYDYLRPGILDTKDALSQYGICYSGADTNSYRAYRPLFYSISGKTIAFLASSDRTGQYNNYQPYLEAGFNKAGFAYMTPYYVKKQIDEVKDVSDYVVVETHSGSEYSTAPGSDYDKDGYEELYPEDEDYSLYLDVPHMWDREIRHFFIDQGADLVICHHPHIIQGVELYNGKLIAHSLGNFLFDLSYPETMPSMILNSYSNDTGFYKYSITPVFIDDYIPKRATFGLGNHIINYLAQKSRDMDTILDIDKENCIANVIMDTLNVDINDIDQIGFFVLSTENDSLISYPVRLKRDGSILSVNSVSPGENWSYRLGRSIMWFGDMEDNGSNMWNLNNNNQNYDNNQYHSGVRSIVHNDNSSTSDITKSYISKTLKTNKTKQHTFCGYIKGINLNQANIKVKYFRYRNFSVNAGIYNLDNPLSGDNDWIFVYKDMEVAENGNFFDIYLESSAPTTGSSNTWYDDIDMIEWDDWKSFDSVEQIQTPNDYYYIQFKTEQNATNFGSFTYKERIYHALIANDNDNIIAPVATLYQNYPNPFYLSNAKSLKTKIKYNLKNQGNVVLTIYNLKGQKVKTLVNSYQKKGIHQAMWDGKNKNGKRVSSGIYFYQLQMNKKVINTKKCIILK